MSRCTRCFNMATVSISLIILLEIGQLLAVETFQYDINAGSLPLSMLTNSGRDKRAETVCELSKGLLTFKQKNEIRKAHNEYRRKMDTTATKVLRLDWKVHVAKRAQALADTCIYAHDKLKDCSNNRLGQNLYVSWGNTVYPKLNVTSVVEAWHNEINYYDLTTNTCDAVCGHYKQVVWWKSQYIGCGYAYCDVLKHPGAEDKKKAVYVVCDYSPPGNYADGRPYTPGKSCSECPEGTKCKDALCIPSSG